MADFSSMVASTDPQDQSSVATTQQAKKPLPYGMPDVGAETKKLSDLEDKRYKENLDSVERSGKLLQDKITSYKDAMSKIKSTPDPNIQDVPEAPSPQMRDPTQVLGSLGSLLAIFGSMKTRAPMTSALNSMAAAMKGFHQGDQERVKLETEKWQNNFKKALQQNQIEMQKYVNALEKNKFNMQAAQADFNLFAVEDKWNEMKSAIDNQHFDKQWALIKLNIDSGEKGAQTLANIDLRKQQEADRQERMRESAQAHADAQQTRGWTVYQDPKTHQMMRANAITGEVEPFQGDTTGFVKPSAGGNTEVPLPGNKDLKGDEYLQSLPAGMADVVKGMVSGKIAFPTGYAMKLPYNQELIAAAAHYDPDNIDAKKYAVKLSVEKDFTSGPTSKNITAINTAIGHMGTLGELAKAMQNNDIATVNRIVNTVKTETGDPAINNAGEAAHAVSSELMRVFRGVGASDQGVEAFEKRLDVNKGPDVILGALQTGATLLDSRINALQDQWKRGMQTKEPFPDLLSPHSKQALESLGVKEKETATSHAATGPVTGQNGVSKSGKPMHFDGTKWRYDQ